MLIGQHVADTQQQRSVQTHTRQYNSTQLLPSQMPEKVCRWCKPLPNAPLPIKSDLSQPVLYRCVYRCVYCMSRDMPSRHHSIPLRLLHANRHASHHLLQGAQKTKTLHVGDKSPRQSHQGTHQRTHAAACCNNVAPAPVLQKDGIHTEDVMHTRVSLGACVAGCAVLCWGA